MITAPGKVLLLGGYAVLDYHPALSIAVTDEQGLGVEAAQKQGRHRLVSKEFGLELEFDPMNPLEAMGKRKGPATAAFAATLSYLHGIGHKAEPVTVELRNSPIFGARNEKSGLGSSAAASVALVAALMDANGHEIGKSRQVIHKIAQVSHAIASGKVGSGFDIASSAFGTIEYVRFEKGLITLEAQTDFERFCLSLKELVHRDWPKLSLRQVGMGQYGLMAFNIKGARTSTVSSVRAVRKLMEHTPELYENLVRGQANAERGVFSAIEGRDNPGIREGMHEARRWQRLLSDWVGRIGMMNFDQIEPPQLTALIERAEKLEGIVAGRCPGSGGYDGVAFLTDGKADEKAIVKIGKELGLDLEYLKIRISEEGVRKV